MNISKEAVDHLASASSADQEKNVENTTSNDAPKLNETLNQQNNVPITMRPLFRVLKGYSLYRLDAKLLAIVDFLRLSSPTSLLQSQDPILVSEMTIVCEAPSNVLKGMKGACKWPSKWTSAFCAHFIIEVVEILENDRRTYQSQATRKSSRKSMKDSLPPAAAKLVSMVESARLKIQGDLMTTGGTTVNKKRKASTLKSVNDLLLKGIPVHNPDFVEVTQEQIEKHLLCPLCNHRSLISVTTKEQADTENQRIQETFKRKLEDWERTGSVGRKPRMDRTQSQVLGCVCFMQNCIGNRDGSGCFECKHNNGSNNMLKDKR